MSDFIPSDKVQIYPAADTCFICHWRSYMFIAPHTNYLSYKLATDT